MPYLVDLVAGLPDYTRPDLAFQQNPQFQPSPASNLTVFYTVGGAYVTVLISFYIVVTTDGTAGNRQARFTMSDGNGNALAELLALNAHPPTTQRVYFWASAISAAYSAGTAFDYMPFPLMPAFPEWTYSFTLVGSAAGDAINLSNAVMLFVPTGPQITLTAPAPIVAPILV